MGCLKVFHNYSDEEFKNLVYLITKDFQPYALKYIAAMKEMETKLEILREDFRVKYSYNPIEHIKTRLKKPDSIIKKAIKNNVELKMNSLLKEINDIAGVRVICTFIEDIYRIVELLKRNPSIKILREKDYVANPKPSGYSGYHLIVEIPVFLTNGEEYVPIEIQIRTMAMDFWACLEHKIKYKFDGDIPENVKDDLRKSAKSVADLDKKMLGLHKIVNQDEDNV